MNQLKDRIREVRKNSPYGTQEKFATALGTTRPAIASYELGKVVPSDTFIQLLCAKFHVNEHWLRTGEGQPQAPSRQDTLARVIADYGLDDNQARLLRVFMSFPPDERRVIAKAFFAIYDHANGEEAPEPVKPFGELSKEEKLARAEEELDAEEKGRQAESPVSTTGR